MANDRRKILRAIDREARKIGDPHKRRVFRKTAVEIGLVETGLQNLHRGDADSVNYRQERASGYAKKWAASGGAYNIPAITARLRQEFEAQYVPGQKSYDAAANIQRPREDLRGRYHDVAHQAGALLKGHGGQGSQPNMQQGASYRTTTTTPGVDNSAGRKEAKLAYLQGSHDPDALLNLGLSLRGLQDTPSSTSTKRVRVPGARRSSSGGSVQAYSSLHGIAKGIDHLAGKYGAPITAGQERGHAVGGDHDPAVKGATARDIGGDETQRRKIFRDLTRQLGVRGTYGGADINVVKHGVRYQIISRPHGTGPHLHVGIRRVKK